MYTLWLTIWKHFISEKGQWLFPSFSLETTKLYISYLQLQGRKYTSPYLYCISTKSNKSSCVHVSYEHNSTYENRIVSMPWTLLDVMVWGYRLTVVSNKQKLPGNKPHDTHLPEYSNATTSGKSVLHTSTPAAYLPSRILPLLQSRESITYI